MATWIATADRLLPLKRPPASEQNVTPWLAVVLVLTVIGTIGNAFTFWLFALFCAIAWVWIYLRVPETKGQSLEQIQRLWPVKITAGDLR
jgi:hypothetical protein